MMDSKNSFKNDPSKLKVFLWGFCNEICVILDSEIKI